MDRKTVYDIIDSERDYQDFRWGYTLSMDRPGKGERSIDEFTNYIKAYTDELFHFSITESSTEQMMDNMRKIAALAVACMEQHGATWRIIDES
jgi:hypothetical protein